MKLSEDGLTRGAGCPTAGASFITPQAEFSEKVGVPLRTHRQAGQHPEGVRPTPSLQHHSSARPQ